MTNDEVNVVFVSLVAASKRGEYVIYVFENLEANTQKDKYIMMTKCPNWDSNPIEEGSVGYVKYKFAQAGDTFFNAKTDSYCRYAHTDNYFQTFVPKTTVLSNGFVVKSSELICQ